MSYWCYDIYIYSRLIFKMAFVIKELNGMKQARSILGILGLLFVSYGLDWAVHSLQRWSSLHFNFYPWIILRILANLFMMLIALIFGLALAKDAHSRLVSLVMVIIGFGALVLPLNPLVLPNYLRLEFIGYYLSLSGALLVLTGLLSIFRHKRLNR
jgi:ABC-type antimicrobial peptide transport system permease subunit